MRFHHLLLSLAVIFATIIAVEGLPQRASSTPSPSPQAVESPAKKQKSNASVTATPIVVSASSHETVAKAALTPAPGGGKGLVWVNTSSHVYHYQKSRWYGKTKQGQYMTEEEAKEDGNRPARSSE